jgi:hypothetical protein
MSTGHASFVAVILHVHVASCTKEKMFWVRIKDAKLHHGRTHELLAMCNVQDLFSACRLARDGADAMVRSWEEQGKKWEAEERQLRQQLEASTEQSDKASKKAEVCYVV